MFYTLKEIYNEQRKIKKQLNLNYIPYLLPNIEVAKKHIERFSKKPILFQWKDGSVFYTSEKDELILIFNKHPKAEI